MSFHCTQCGLCCENMDKVLAAQHPQPWMQELVKAFPYGTKPNGQCEQFENGVCLVYERRPLLCDIERIADEVDIGMTKDEWFELNYQGCRTLQSRIPVRLVA
jgi:Fe-S-cluster containining protein